VKKKKPPANVLTNIRSNWLSRGVSLAKAGVRAGGMATAQWFSDDPDVIKKNLLKHVHSLAKEMGQLKGSAMKVGQLLSTYGENFLPKEVNDVLKTLQQQSPPLAWKKVSALLKKELGKKLEDLEIDPDSWAAASIGQVHRGVLKATGAPLVVKIQYPGVKDAIDTDLKFFKVLLTMSRFIPRSPRLDQIFDEVREMLYQEMDYSKELAFTKKFTSLLADDPRFVIAKPFEGYCTDRLIVSSFEDGFVADEEAVQSLPQERRDAIGAAFLELYFRELLEFRLMQTDPHLGNYRIRLRQDGEDQLVLFDFGAVREIPADFQHSYRYLMEGVLAEDPKLIGKGGRAIGLLQPDDTPELVEKYCELCLLIGEPFSKAHSKNYDWGSSDLPKRVASKGSELVFGFKPRTPPRELVFLDRKLGGVFVFLSVLKSRLDARPILQAALRR
jgi:predicted unusual protein kinase regulating ubiquinone biosynthesis (AarF/ABC1/UbiB family)